MVERRLTTIVAMDVVGYSRQMERDEVGTLDRLKAARATVVDPAIDRHGGRTVKLMGDGTLVEFPSVVGALQCAVSIQRDLGAGKGAANGSSALSMRIGMHLGDVIVDGDDIYGDGVNIASRLESIAPPGGIVLSSQVHDHIGSNVPVGFVPLGEQSIKNISRPILAYRVDMESDGSAPDVLYFEDFELDLSLFELRRAGERVTVEPQVFDLVVFLARNNDRVVTREEVFRAIWGDRIVSDSALSGQIKAARRVLGDDGASQRIIATVHGRGFRFVADVSHGPSKKDPAPAVEADPPVQLELPQAGERFAAAAHKPSVAVLPFTNLNHDREEDYFADGVSEDITTALSKNRWLSVVARNPAFAFRDSNDSVRSIGEQLRADYIVTGNVRKAGTRFRITVQVADTATEQSIWSERFDRDMVDIFDLQDEISDLVASRIESELGLTERRKAERRPRKNLGAWDLYQLGTVEFYKFTPESNQRAQELMRQAIALDPDFASAYSRLAYAIVLNMVYFDAATEAAMMDEALAMAQRAIVLDHQDANAHFTIGRVHLARREYEQAINALELALELNPCLAVSYCGLGDSLAYEGRLDEAIEQFEIAIKLSPHDPFRWAFYSYRALAHLFRGQFQDAVQWARRSVQIPNAQYWARAHLAAALGHLGDEEQARAAVDDLMKVKPEFSVEFARDRLFYLKRDDQMATYLEGLRKAGMTEKSPEQVAPG